MHIYYECNPVRDLRVIPAANIITRACLAPCFFDGKSQYHTIPRRFSHYEARHFAGGKADKAVPGGEASKLYELNVWAMTCVSDGCLTAEAAAAGALPKALSDRSGAVGRVNKNL